MATIPEIPTLDPTRAHVRHVHFDRVGDVVYITRTAAVFAGDGTEIEGMRVAVIEELPLADVPPALLAALIPTEALDDLRDAINAGLVSRAG